MVNDPGAGQRCARLRVPQVFPRLLPVPSEEKADTYERLGLKEAGSNTFVWLEEVITANLDLLFPGLEVATVAPFRVTRDADVEIEEDEAADLLSAMKEVVGQRHFASAVWLQVDRRIPPDTAADLMPRNLDGRVEVLFPLRDPSIRRAVKEILTTHLRDTVRARRLLPDGNWERVAPSKRAQPLDNQRWMIDHRGGWHGEE